MADLEEVGGKNASLGEMVSQLADLGVRVPNGFATTAAAYRSFIGDTGLAERIDGLLDGLDTDDVRRLAEVGTEIRAAVVAQEFPADLEADVRAAYDELVEESRWRSRRSRSARRATAEDLPDASFAGQQETFLNVRGIDAVLTAIREVFASLYNDRAIAYRVHHGFAHADVALSAGVQRMVRSDIGASGVMFTMDTESGFTDAVFVTSAYGLGEGVVQGAVNPDEFYVYKPALRDGRPAVLKRGVGDKATKMVYTDDATVGRTTEFVDVAPEDRRLLSLTDDEVEELARHALVIEDHYGRPMDIEWGKDGVDGQIYVLQARPETVQSRATGALERYKMPKESVDRRRGAGRGPRDRPEDRRRRGPGARERRPDERLPGRRGARRRHDRPRLGADHEAGRRDRDQPRRADLPRRDHRPRARHPRRGRLRQRDPRPGRRPRGHRLVRRGRHRAGLRGPARLLGRAHRARHDAGHPGQDHDERRHAGAGVLVRPAAAPRRRAGPARVRHQPADRHPPAGAAPARVGP